MKILLINPSKYDENGVLMRFLYGAFPPLNLMILASIARTRFPGTEIRIVDEFIQEVPFGEKFDLVGITTLFTSSYPRVRDIARRFRAEGVPVVLGGTHVTCNSEACLNDADSLVVGEAEESFTDLLQDCKAGGPLKKTYSNSGFLNLDKIAPGIPAYDLIDTNRYLKVGVVRKSNYFAVETSRGCPMLCTFCTVKQIHGAKQRFRPISSVIDEIRFLKKNYGTDFFNFTDDSFLLERDYYTDLLKLLTKENIRFHCEISTQITQKADLLPLLKKAGCISTFIGLETLNRENLKSVKKYHNNPDQYADVIRLLNRNDLPVCPSFLFGFDHDHPDSFRQTVDFLKTVTIQRVIFGILTPFPGTDIYDEILKSGRILKDDLSLYDGSKIVFRPLNLTTEELVEGFWEAYNKFYAIGEILKRLLRTSRGEFIFSLFTNLRFHGLVKKRTLPFSSGIKRIR